MLSSQFSTIHACAAILILDSTTRMFCNRPPTASSIPITLLHPIFGQFVDDCKNHPLDPQSARFALKLATEVCKFYKSESDRGVVFREWIFNRFSIKLSTGKIEETAFETDGHCASVGFHVYLNTESQN